MECIDWPGPGHLLFPGKGWRLGAPSETTQAESGVFPKGTKARSCRPLKSVTVTLSASVS